MDKKIFYVHDQEPLGKALKVFLKTHRHLLVVVNSFEEVVGIVTIEDVLEAILGKMIIDEFDQHDDLRAVAQRQAAVEHKNHPEVKELPPDLDQE